MNEMIDGNVIQHQYDPYLRSYQLQDQSQSLIMSNNHHQHHHDHQHEYNYPLCDNGHHHQNCLLLSETPTSSSSNSSSPAMSPASSSYQNIGLVSTYSNNCLMDPILLSTQTSINHDNYQDQQMYSSSSSNLNVIDLQPLQTSALPTSLNLINYQSQTLAEEKMNNNLIINDIDPMMTNISATTTTTNNDGISFSIKRESQETDLINYEINNNNNNGNNKKIKLTDHISSTSSMLNTIQRQTSYQMMTPPLSPDNEAFVYQKKSLSTSNQTASTLFLDQPVNSFLLEKPSGLQTQQQITSQSQDHFLTSPAIYHHQLQSPFSKSSTITTMIKLNGKQSTTINNNGNSKKCKKTRTRKSLLNGKGLQQQQKSMIDVGMDQCSTDIHIDKKLENSSTNNNNNNKNNHNHKQDNNDAIDNLSNNINKHSIKRTAHLSAEFRYRTKLNEKINKLRILVSKHKLNLSKSAVLTKSIEMIIKLQKLAIQLQSNNLRLQQKMITMRNIGQQRKTINNTNIVDNNANNDNDNIMDGFGFNSPKHQQIYQETNNNDDHDDNGISVANQNENNFELVPIGVKILDKHFRSNNSHSNINNIQMDNNTFNGSGTDISLQQQDLLPLVDNIIIKNEESFY